MKVLAVLLMCAFVAVQGRSAVVKSTKAVAELGDTPWLVHLRIAVSTSGLLNSGAGSLIASNWVLTSASVVQDVRFIWVRYGVVNVINPELVTETSAVRVNPDVNVALISINRIVQSTANIAPVALVGADVPESASFYAFGSNEQGGPGEVLSYYTVALEQNDGVITATSEDGAATEYDLGAPLVSDGVQVALLVAPADDSSAGSFLPTAGIVDWVESETGLALTSAQPEVDSLLVRVAN